jgi:L-threonylcarbamoyladenylate synthase
MSSLASPTKAALEVLTSGGVVAAATESFFGLFADVTNPRALDALFLAKPRGHDRGVPLVVPSEEVWRSLVVELPDAALALARAFWPGPLSIALPAKPSVDARLVSGGSIAVRLPAPSRALELVRDFARPLTATSANQPGEPPPTHADAAATYFPDGSVWVDTAQLECPGGAPSTIVVFEQGGVRLAREGAVSKQRVEAALGAALRTQ